MIFAFILSFCNALSQIKQKSIIVYEGSEDDFEPLQISIRDSFSEDAFEILEVRGQGREFFAANRMNLSLYRAIDFEEIQLSQGSPSFSFPVLISNEAGTETMEGIVETIVTNLNDHDPFFVDRFNSRIDRLDIFFNLAGNQECYGLSEENCVRGIPEFSSGLIRNGSVVAQLNADDVDCRLPNECTSSLEFSVEENPWIELAGNGILQLKNAEQFDFETDRGPFRIIAKVIDFGVRFDRRQRTSRIPVYLYVKDFPDSAPVYQRDRNFFQISENSPQNTIIGEVRAFDGDEEINWPIFYSTLDERITVDRTSGKIFIKNVEAFDREANEKLEFEIIATETPTGFYKSENAKSSVAKVTVTLLDVNDNEPYIVDFDDDFVFSVDENALAGSEITGSRIVIQDEDQYSNTHWKASLTVADPKCKIDVIPREGYHRNSISLRTTAPMDFEEIQFCDAQLKSSLAFFKNISIFLNNINDNSPIFEFTSYDFNVSENVIPPIWIGQVHAIDDDIGEFGRVHYQLLSGSEEFSLNQTTGDVFSHSSFDREKSAAKKIRIRAFDNGQRSTNVEVNIHILDINDEAPFFEYHRISKSVNENSKNISIGQVFVNDPDSDSNLTLEIDCASSKSENIIGDIVDIETRRKGEKIFDLWLNEALDYERIDSINCVLSAVDVNTSPGYENSTIHNFILYVENLNDNAPVFLETATNVSVKEDSPIGSFLITVAASDEDNDRIHFFCSSESIIVDRDSGNIFLNKTYDFEISKYDEIEVFASDGVFNATKIIRIHVNDVNDNLPEFTKRQSSINITEDTEIGAIIGEFCAKDLDSLDEELDFIILSNPAQFEMQKISPFCTDLMLIKKLDFETDPATINLRIRVLDGLTSVQSNMVETDVKIHVIDVNDNAPSFKNNLYKIEVLETIASLQTVLVLDIIDEDTAQVNSLGVMLKNGTEYFAVKEEREVFSIIVVEDVSLIGRGFETITLELELTDGIFKTAGFVKVEVQGVNLNSPVFYNNNNKIVTNMMSIEIEENRDELLLNLSSADADSGPNGQTRMKMKATADASDFKFSNGALRFIKIPDYEVKSEFTVVLDAFDEGVPPRTTSLTVVIQILDVDDNEPVLNEKIVNSLTISIKESTPSTIVFPLNTVVDVDSIGKEDNRLCIINSDNSKSCSEQVNSTWPLEISELFDYEKTSEIWIQIGTARSPVDDFREDQTAELKIFIEDINDNPPIFLETSVLERGISLLEDPAIGSSLYSFLISDKDSRYENTVPIFSILNSTSSPFTIDRNGIMRLEEPLKSTVPILTTIKCENLAAGPCSYKNITFYPIEEENIFEIQCLNIAAFDEKAFREAIESQIKSSKIFFHKSTRRVSKSGDIISGGTIRFHMEDIARNITISVKRIFNDLSSAEFQEHVRNFGLVLEQSQVAQEQNLQTLWMTIWILSGLILFSWIVAFTFVKIYASRLRTKFRLKCIQHDNFDDLDKEPEETDNPLKECQFDTQSQCPYTLEDTAPEDSMSTESSITNHDSDPECENYQKPSKEKAASIASKSQKSVQEESF